MHTVALLLKYNTAIAATQKNNRYLLYFSGMAQQRGFWQRDCCRANREKSAFRVTRPMVSRVVRVPRNDLVET